MILKGRNACASARFSITMAITIMRFYTIKCTLHYIHIYIYIYIYIPSLKKTKILVSIVRNYRIGRT